MELKSKQLAVLMLSMFIFTLGFGIMIPVMGFFTKNMGATALDLGLLMASMSLMQFLFAPVGGRISDRVGRKPVMLAGLFGFAVSFAIVGVSTQLWMLFVALVLGGILSAGIWPASLAYIADISSHEERGKFMGYAGAASGLGIIAGPAISSILANWGLTLPFFASSALALFTTLATLVLLPETLNRESRSGGIERRISFLATLKTPLGMFFFLMLLVSFAIACVDTTYVFFISDRFGMSELPSAMPVLGGTMTLTGPNVLSILFTAMGFIAVASQLGVGVMIQKYGEEKTIIAGLALLGAGMAAVVLAADLASLLVVTCLTGLGGNLLNPAINTYVSKRSPRGQQGAMMGFLGSFNSIGRVLGPSVGGFAYTISMLLPYVGPAVLALASMAVMGCSIRGGARRDTQAAGTEAGETGAR
ncbi:MAG: multidrug resistance protein MdtH [Methanocella sp. PtaU1.Bin125]|nr:MAG: multidrug resistance protein MdtH [Methanocella sp. PtaU1.Bin125]